MIVIPKEKCLICEGFGMIDRLDVNVMAVCPCTGKATIETVDYCRNTSFFAERVREIRENPELYNAYYIKEFNNVVDCLIPKGRDLLEIGLMPMSNAFSLARKPADIQEKYLEEACTSQPAIFIPRMANMR